MSIDLLLVLDFSVLNDFLSFFHILKVSFRLNIKKHRKTRFRLEKKIEQVLDFGIVIKLLSFLFVCWFVLCVCLLFVSPPIGCGCHTDTESSLNNGK